MYVIRDEMQQQLMAIIKDNQPHKVHLAVKEEFGFKEIKMEGFEHPDFGQNISVFYVGTTEDNIEVQGNVQITKLISY